MTTAAELADGKAAYAASAQAAEEQAIEKQQEVAALQDMLQRVGDGLSCTAV